MSLDTLVTLLQTKCVTFSYVYDTLTNNCLLVYFLQLPDYNPLTGVNTSKHGKFPFLSSLSGLFEPAAPIFEYQKSFPLERIETDKQQVFYVS